MRRRGAAAPGRRRRRDRLVPRALDGRARARRRLAWSRSTRTRAATAGRRRSRADATRGDADHDAFHANLAAAGVADRVRHVRKFSADAHGDVPGRSSLLYVDGAHRFGPARADLAGWGGRVAPGGTMLVHDAFSSIGVTLALLRDVRRLARLALHRAHAAASPSTSGARSPAPAGRSARHARASCPGSPATSRSRCWCWRGGGAGRSGSGSTRPRPGRTELRPARAPAARRRRPRPSGRRSGRRVLGVVAAAVLRPDERREDGTAIAEQRARRRARARAAPIPRHRTRNTPSANSGVAAGGERRTRGRAPAATRDAAPRGRAGSGAACGSGEPSARRFPASPAAARRAATPAAEQRQQATISETRSRRARSRFGRERDLHAPAVRRDAPGGRRSAAPAAGSPRSRPSQLARRPRL